MDGELELTNAFWVSDLHIGHKKIIEYSKEHRLDTNGQAFGSIEQHDEMLRYRWNSKVNPTDTVWILGDVCINKRNISFLDSLNGRKLLVMGNHDNFGKEFFDSELLTRVDRTYGCAEKRFGEITTIMSHIPVHPCQLEYRYHFNLHGHLHTHKIKDSNGQEDLRYINLCMEHWNMTPVSFDELSLEIQRRVILLNIDTSNPIPSDNNAQLD
jgi:calcineurin-like phosphoesterase family protein